MDEEMAKFLFCVLVFPLFTFLAFLNIFLPNNDCVKLENNKMGIFLAKMEKAFWLSVWLLCFGYFIFFFASR